MRVYEDKKQQCVLLESHMLDLRSKQAQDELARYAEKECLAVEFERKEAEKAEEYARLR